MIQYEEDYIIRFNLILSNYNKFNFKIAFKHIQFNNIIL